MTALTILIADDHIVVRAGIRALISAHEDFTVVAEAGCGREAVELASSLRPDIAILDISMPQMNGVQVTEALRGVSPQTRVLAHTVHEDRSYMRQMLQAGAFGYILKRGVAGELVRALRAIGAGGVYVDPAVTGRLLEGAFHARELGSALTAKDLSSRELEVAQLLVRGYTNKDIANRLEISVKTVDTHKARLMEKLKLATRADLLHFGLSQGWLDRKS